MKGGGALLVEKFKQRTWTDLHYQKVYIFELGTQSSPAKLWTIAIANSTHSQIRLAMKLIMKRINKNLSLPIEMVKLKIKYFLHGLYGSKVLASLVLSVMWKGDQST